MIVAYEFRGDTNIQSITVIEFQIYIQHCLISMTARIQYVQNQTHDLSSCSTVSVKDTFTNSVSEART